MFLLSSFCHFVFFTLLFLLLVPVSFLYSFVYRKGRLCSLGEESRKGQQALLEDVDLGRGEGRASPVPRQPTQAPQAGVLEATTASCLRLCFQACKQ